MKTDQNRALFAHETYRQTGTVTVAPSRAFNGPQQIVRLDLTDEAQVVFQHPLFDGHLPANVQVLHLAAAAGPGVRAKVGAARCYPL